MPESMCNAYFVGYQSLLDLFVFVDVIFKLPFSVVVIIIIVIVDAFSWLDGYITGVVSLVVQLNLLIYRF